MIEGPAAGPERASRSPARAPKYGLRTPSMTLLRSRTSARAGISLLGLLLWLCALAVISLLAIPQFFNRTDVTLKHAVELLAKDLHSAQNRAAYHRAPTLFRFRSTGWEAHDLDAPFSGAAPHDYPIERSFAGIFDGVKIVRIAFGDDDALEFDARGEALEGGEVELAFRGQQRVLRLDPGTGRTTIVGPEGAISEDHRRGRSRDAEDATQP